MNKKKFRSYEDAKTFIQSLGLKKREDWVEYSKSGNRPDDIPSAPNVIYKNKGWKNWKDWLGIEYLSFFEARDFVQSLKMKSAREWEDYCKSGKKPENIRSTPQIVYKNKGWTNWGDFLGTGIIAAYLIEYRSFEDARNFAQQLGIKRREDWDVYCKSGNKPDDIPRNPNMTYKNKGWINIGNWLGTGRLANRTIRKNYLPLNEARKKARELAKKYNIKTWNDWTKAAKEGKIPDNIPMNPDRVYSKKKNNEN